MRLSRLNFAGKGCALHTITRQRDFLFALLRVDVIDQDASLGGLRIRVGFATAVVLMNSPTVAPISHVDMAGIHQRP